MLTSNHLISDIHSQDSLFISGPDHSLSVYFHFSGDPINVALGTQYYQTITPLEFPNSLFDHALLLFGRISSVANVSFQQVYHHNDADISIFFDSELKSNDNTSTTTLGLTLNLHDSILGRRSIEIFLNGPELTNSSFDLQAYVVNHEILHALGFEHTFDDSDGDYYLSTDPLLSATPEQTTMSYRSPETGLYPVDISEADYMALIDIWGPVVDNTPSLMTSSPTPIYRLFQPETGAHLFSSNQGELEYLTQRSHYPFLNEGIAYTVDYDADVEVHRFFNKLTGRHLYTVSDFETQLLLDDIHSSYLYEGVAFKVFDTSISDTFRTPVYRFYDSISHIHYFTANSYELDLWTSSNPLWINEGIAWYA